MFDGLDIGPIFCAPFVALLVGTIIYGLGSFTLVRIKNKTVQDNDRLKRILILVSIAVLACACISSVALGIGSAVPSPWIKPSTIDISGQWFLTQCTAEQFTKGWENILENPGHIKFNLDKTAEIKNLPALWALSNPEHKDYGEYISGSGIWYIEETPGRIGNREWILSVQLNETNGKKGNQTFSFYFDGHLPPYSLAYEGNINMIHLTKNRITLSHYLCLPWGY